MVGEEIAQRLFYWDFGLKPGPTVCSGYLQCMVGIAGLDPADYGEGFFSPIAWRPFISVPIERLVLGNFFGVSFAGAYCRRPARSRKAAAVLSLRPLRQRWCSGLINLARMVERAGRWSTCRWFSIMPAEPTTIIWPSGESGPPIYKGPKIGKIANLSIRQSIDVHPKTLATIRFEWQGSSLSFI